MVSWSAEFASPDRRHLQVFATSWRLSLLCRSGLFRPVTLLGFGPFRGFPPLVAERLSARHAPPDVSAKRPAFRGLSNQWIRARTSWPVKATQRPILSWASSSPGYSPHPRRHMLLGMASPLALCCAVSPGGGTEPGAPGYRSTGGLACLFREQPTLLRSPSSSLHLPLERSPAPGSWLHLGSRATSP